MKHVRPPGGARREGVGERGPPRPTAMQTHCRPAGTRRASRDARRQRPDVPTDVYDPSSQHPGAETPATSAVRPDMDDARGGAAPAAGAAGRPVSVQKYRGELPKTSTVISISSTRLYVLHTSCYPYNTQTHAGASTAAFERNVQDPISHWT